MLLQIVQTSYFSGRTNLQVCAEETIIPQRKQYIILDVTQPHWHIFYILNFSLLNCLVSLIYFRNS